MTYADRIATALAALATAVWTYNLILILGGF